MCSSSCPYSKLQNQSGVLTNVSILIFRSVLKRWRLHSFDFAFGLACVSASKGKCVQCAVALEFFRAVAIFFVFFLKRLPFKEVLVGVGCCQNVHFLSVSLMLALSSYGFR